MSFRSSHHFDVDLPFHSSRSALSSRQSSILSLPAPLSHHHLQDHPLAHSLLSRIPESQISIRSRDAPYKEDTEDHDSFHDCLPDSDPSSTIARDSQNTIHQENLDQQLPLSSMVPSTPIPTLQMLMICLVTFVEPVQFGMLFPFIYFLVKDFNITERDQDLGFYVGLLASSFCLAQLVTCLPWGHLSDKIGRRPVILLGLLGNAVTCFLFGFSKTYGYAIVLRSLNGFLNGNVGVVKSMLGEMTDASNRGRAFSYWESAYGLGTIVGPMLGGILVDPVKNYPYLFTKDSIFATYPYLLPCVVSSIVSVLGSLIGFFLMEETAPAMVSSSAKKTTYARDSQTTISQFQMESQPLLLHQNQELDQDEFDSTTSTTTTSTPTLTLRETLTPKVLSSIFLYASWCLVTILYEEVFALYLAEPLHKGGLSFSSLEIGTILSLSGLIQVISQLFLFPVFERKWGLLGTFRIAALLLALFSFLLPFTTDYALWIGSASDPLQNPNQKNSQVYPLPFQKAYVSIVLFTLLAGKTLATVIGYIPVIIFVNDSAPSPQSLGTVHGTGQVFASLVRSIGPTLGGGLWSWSLEKGRRVPFDFHFTWFITAALCVVSFGAAKKMQGLLGGGGADVDVNRDEDGQEVGAE